MDVVNKLLEQKVDYKPITVDKYIEFDIGALTAIDSNILDEKLLQNNREDYILNLTRDNTQLLFNQIWELETDRKEDVILAKLPKQKFRLPRFKPIPKPKPLTKWEQFAKAKGIDNKKKSKSSWDEQLQKWVPLYGFKRASAQKDKDWLIEVPANANPMEDQFAKKLNAKSEKVAKNELQRLRNIAKAKKVKVPRFGLNNPEVSSAKELQAAITVAKASTASLGKFQNKLPNEKEARGISAIVPGGSRKRKLEPISAIDEKNKSLAIADAVLNKKPKLNIEKAVSKQINEEQVARAEEKRNEGGGKRTNNRKNNNKNNNSKFKNQKSIQSGRVGKKPKPKNASKGQRKGKLGGNGRKRR